MTQKLCYDSILICASFVIIFVKDVLAILRRGDEKRCEKEAEDLIKSTHSGKMMSTRERCLCVKDCTIALIREYGYKLVIFRTFFIEQKIL